jgi:signal transduction histidine kinase/ligand-binding sensor domain-containing protein/ActR/RegA family two-component response regulator
MALLVVAISGGGDPARGEDAGLAAQPIRVRTWRVEDGLPLSQVQFLTQARDGFLWMGARHEGVFRFDGVSFSAPAGDLHTGTPYPGDNDISAVMTGRDGSLWVGSHQGLWKQAGGRWEQYTTAQGLSHDAITALHEDRDGVLWIGTLDGLNRLHGRSIRAYGPPDPIRLAHISAIASDRAGDLWLGTTVGELYRLHDGRFAAIPGGPERGSDTINAILEGSDGSLWVGTWCYGLGRWRQGAVRIYGAQDGLVQPEILALGEDFSGRIWVGTRKGLYMIRDDPHAAVIAGTNSRVNLLTDDETFALRLGREGSMWVGTGSGLHQFSERRLNVYSTGEGLTDRNVGSVHPARDGGVWVGMNGGGVARLRDGKVVATYGEVEGLSSRYVTSICECRDGTVWVGTWGHALNRFQDGRFVADSGSGPMAMDVIRSIYEDRAGDLWVGTWGQGLRRLRGGRMVATYTTLDGLADNQVRVLAEDAAGDLWIATHRGLSRFRDGRLTTYTKRDGLSEDSIFALRPDADRSLWIGTWGGGLNRLRDGRFTAYTTEDGLYCDTICEILSDGSDFWIGSPKGIFRVRKADIDAFDAGSARSIMSVSYGAADGMASAQCNRGTQPSGCRTADGRLWFATIDGVVMVDPRRLRLGGVPPTAVMVRVQHDGRSVGGGPGLRRAAGRGDVEFHYTASALKAPDKALFQYKLQGLDEDWHKPVSRRMANYTNLPPGSYTFRVRASSGDGVWGEATSFGLTLDPPFYQRNEFRLASLLAAAAIAALAYRHRMARLRARERELIALVDRSTAEARAAQQAAEQANRAKDRFLAVLSHELRTPLTPVLLAVNSLVDAVNLAPEVREHLEMIGRNIELEAHLVDDLLDISRIERGQLSLQFARVDVHAVIARVLEVCSALVSQAGLEVVEDLAAEEHYAQADLARLMQLFWNLIRNAAKFTPPGGLLTIRSYNADTGPLGTGVDSRSAESRVLGPEVGPEPGGRLLVVEVHDTGIGIEPELLDRIFDPFEQGGEEPRRRGGLGLGLAIGRAVAEAHRGRLTASSPGKGQGATFRLELMTASAPAPSQASAPRPDEPTACTPRPRPAALRILLVEDNADTLRYLGLSLRRRGYQVATAASLAAAREAATGGDFDLLISDIELTDGSGLELMRELQPRGIPGIAFSGYGSADDLRESRAAGFASHLVKPVLDDVLDETICRVAASRPRNDGAILPSTEVSNC